MLINSLLLKRKKESINRTQICFSNFFWTGWHASPSKRSPVSWGSKPALEKKVSAVFSSSFCGLVDIITFERRQKWISCVDTGFCSQLPKSNPPLFWMNDSRPLHIFNFSSLCFIGLFFTPISTPPRSDTNWKWNLHMSKRNLSLAGLWLGSEWIYRSAPLTRITCGTYITIFIFLKSIPE